MHVTNRNEQKRTKQIDSEQKRTTTCCLEMFRRSMKFDTLKSSQVINNNTLSLSWIITTIMFRRLADRLFPSSAEQDIATLQNMGFIEIDARRTLQQTNGNVEEAANILLERGAPTTTTNTPAHQINRQQVEDEELQQALQASWAVQDTNKSHSRRNLQSAAVGRAGKAALNRFNTGTTSTATAHSSGSTSPLSSHPTVKIPKKLSEKTKEEQILRTADRLKSSVKALDTLYKTLKTLQSDPSNPKFRTVDQTTLGYQKSLANAPGAKDFLLAMNYRQYGPNTLSLDFVDQATIYLGISALEQTKLTPEYQQAKALIQFQKDVLQILHSADNDTQEAINRSNQMSKLPTEPAMGGAWIFVNFLGMDNKLQRKFDGDDTLEDVLHWIAGNGTQILEKLHSGEWSLVDAHRNPPSPLDIQTLAPKTLQYIGCWPSGKLIVQPTEPQEQGAATISASSRGLGAAM
jgi:hypothetical protein